MKPKTPQAMHNLICQVRQSIPFDLPKEEVCDDLCNGCSKKVIDFLETELESWAYRIQQGEIPTLGEINTLAKRSKKIYKILQKNGIVLENIK